jgi:hypothetical protein
MAKPKIQNTAAKTAAQRLPKRQHISNSVCQNSSALRMPKRQQYLDIYLTRGKAPRTAAGCAPPPRPGAQSPRAAGAWTDLRTSPRPVGFRSAGRVA